VQNVNIELLGRIRNVIAEVLQVNIDEITPEIAFGDIPQWDSLGHMEILLALEESFAIAVTAETISDLVSLPLIIEHITNNQNA
jgi:acyl carrier protein